MSPEFSRRVDSSECYWHKCVLGLLKVPVNIHVVTLSVSTWSSDSNDPPKLTMGKNHEELYHLLHGELCVAVDWFRNNGMLTNPEKFKSMILGLTNLDFTFVIDGIIIERRDNIDLLGINIDSRLSFDRHTQYMYQSILQVMSRFRHLVSRDVRARQYKAFILPYFQYCSAVWHFCGVCNKRKLEPLNKQALWSVFNDVNVSVTCPKLNI